MLQPQTVIRDSYGDWTHPALTELFSRGGDPEREHIPGDEWSAWLAEHNIETDWQSMEYELDDTHPAWIRHFDEGNPGSVGWDPEPPGPEWHMLTIHDTEDGPVVCWYREIPSPAGANVQ